MELDVESILSNLGVNYGSQGTKRKVKGISSVKEATKDELSFCWYEGEKGISLISNSKAGVLLCKKSMEKIIRPKEGTQFFFLDNPRLVFVKIMNHILNKNKIVGISTRAAISDTAKIGSGCYIGDFAIIGENCEVGDNTIIGQGARLLQNCFIGNDCIIQPGVTIGADGFAFERHATGELERFPHVKGVKIGNNVEICVNSSIARGSLSDTLIGEGSKIDALVHIAHNVVIGKSCELTAGTIIGGSTSLGDMCWTGLNSTLKDNIKVGNNVIVGAGAAVIHDVIDGDVVAGVPAKSIKDKVKSDMLFLMAGQKKN